MELNDLLTLASAGWHLFPLLPNGKKPLPGSHGCDDATTDATRITAWYRPELNWGLNCGMSGLLVLDVDTKKGPEVLVALDKLKGAAALDTMAVRTPSGGWHYYYRGAGPSTVEKVGKGLDTRGAGGYVVIPGCTIDGAAYVYENGQPAREVPDWLAQPLARVHAAPDERDHTPAVELDRPGAVSAAVAYLAGAPVAIEGEGGDTVTYHTACAVRDRGISEEVCAELMAAHWNDRCAPPWDTEELARKVRNAYTYAQEAPGAKSPERFLAPIAPSTPESLATLASSIDLAKLPARRWILGRRLIRGFVSLLIAPGGASKSTLSMLDLLSVCSGMNLTGDEVHERGTVWVWNTEDPDDELGRRIHASVRHHKVGVDKLASFHVSSGLTRQLTVAASERGTLMVNDELLNAITAYIKKHHILVWCVDPLAEAHQLEENDNQQMVALMRCFRRVAQECDCAVLLVHHTRKPGNTAGGNGDANSARGASSVVGAARIVHTLYAMGEDEADEYGIPEEARRWYVRLDDAKGNLAPPSSDVRWFKRVDHVLDNGDHVGVLEVSRLEKLREEDLTPARDAVLRFCGRGMYDTQTPLSELAEDIIGKDDMMSWKGTRRPTLERQIREVFAGSKVFHEGIRIHCEELRGSWYLWTVRGVKMLGDAPAAFEEEAKDFLQ